MSAPIAPPVAISTQPESQPTELSAINRVVWFSVIWLAGIVSGWILAFYFSIVVISGLGGLNLPPNPTPAEVSAALGPLFQALSTVVPLDLAMEGAALLTLTLALRQFGKIDRASFSVPSAFMVVMIVGLLVVSVGVIPLFNSMPSMMASLPPNPGPGTPASLDPFLTALLAEVAFIGIGALLLFIGLIGGLILGLWRVGSRYDETIIKLGAIFTIIPLLNAVAPILLLVGSLQVKSRLKVVR